MNELFEAGKLVPVMDGPYTLSDVPERSGSLAQAIIKARSSSLWRERRNAPGAERTETPRAVITRRYDDE